MLLTARDAGTAHETTAALAAETGAEVHGRSLELADPQSISAAGAAVGALVSPLDALVHHAGAIFDSAREWAR